MEKINILDLVDENGFLLQGSDEKIKYTDYVEISNLVILADYVAKLCVKIDEKSGLRVVNTNNSIVFKTVYAYNAYTNISFEEVSPAKAYDIIRMNHSFRANMNMNNIDFFERLVDNAISDLQCNNTSVFVVAYMSKRIINMLENLNNTLIESIKNVDTSKVIDVINNASKKVVNLVNDRDRVTEESKEDGVN